ncbi:membrane protein [Citrobacter amalonaticus]|nr:membrane protein [Citrobacter amalonaticus]
MVYGLLTNEKIYHMILVIIIGMRGETMLQRALGSGWGVLLPGIVIAGLAFADLSLGAWKIIIVFGLLLTPAMLYHKHLRHFVLLPSCVVLIGGMMLVMMNWNQG